MALYNYQQGHQGCPEVRIVSRAASVQVRRGLVYTTSIFCQRTQHEQLHGELETQRSAACPADAARPSQDDLQLSHEISWDLLR